MKSGYSHMHILFFVNKNILHYFLLRTSKILLRLSVLIFQRFEAQNVLLTAICFLMAENQLTKRPFGAFVCSAFVFSNDK